MKFNHLATKQEVLRHLRTHGFQTNEFMGETYTGLYTFHIQEHNNGTPDHAHNKQGDIMANETEEWTLIHKSILGLVIAVMLMLLIQVIRYFVSK